MIINRRNFLKKSAIAASSVPAISLLSGCGSSSDDGAPASSTSSVAALVSSLQTSKVESDSLHSDSDNNIATSSTTTSNAAARVLLSSSLASSQVSNYFTDKEPESSYLTATDSVWKEYSSYNDLSYQQFTHQFTKLTASLRLYEYKKENASSSSNAPSLQATAVAQLSPALADSFSVVDSLVELITKNFTTLSLDAITAFIVFIKSELDDLDSVESLLYSLAAYTSLDKLLEGILLSVKNEAVSDLDFSSQEDIMLSLARMSIASISLIGSMSLEKLTTSSQAPALGTALEMTAEEIEVYLRNISLQSSLSMIMMELMSTYVSNTNTSIQTTVEGLMGSTELDLTSEELTAREDLQAELKSQSTVMAVVAVVMKALFAMISAKAVDSIDSSFTAGSDASEFAILFGSDTLPQDEALNSFMDNLQSLLDTDASFTDVFELISTMSTSFDTTVIDTAATADAEETAFTFASTISSDAYEFTSQTETDAYNFATYMAGLAYDFTMKIEDDAYNFAMQGMEYGYLFASQGEDVGIMADRILWMAVQIGQMSDRIGEMADRIVYTETLIVYTEMLILDFGLLIYGGMKMITNLMLTGMALVLDREWYENDSEDQIVTLIGANMSQMMENMQGYSLAVLENQNTLRETTLSAMDWVGTIQTAPEA